VAVFLVSVFPMSSVAAPLAHSSDIRCTPALEAFRNASLDSLTAM
jgi:hypothetical protein